VRRIRPWAAGAVIALLVLLATSGAAWQALHRPTPIVVAFAGSMTGEAAGFGEEARAATQFYLDDVHAAGDVDGHPVVLQTFDDRSQPAVAGSNVSAVLDSPAVAVLGHSLSATSVAAGPGYKAGRILALTGNASADEVTQDNPYYFRALSPNTVQAAFLAGYIHTVMMGHNTLFLRSPDIDLVSSEAPYGRSFRASFTTGNGGVTPEVFMVQPGENIERTAVEAAERLAQEPERRIIVIGVAPDVIPPVLRAIRKGGIRSPIILAAGAAADGFAAQFANDPEEVDSPGYFTENVFAIAPMILDNTGALGQGLATTGHRAGWVAARAQDAARLMVEALRRAHIGAVPNTRQADRVREALAGINRPEAAVPGINGPLYLNAAREMPRPIRYGFFRQGRFVSAPLQLVRVQDPDLVDIDHETFVDAFPVRSTPGKPALFDTASRVEYGGFDTEVVLRRNVGAFMVKTLVPLFLLGLVVFATLFFPSTLARERTTIPVTGILTSAVLLISISNQLPALGYMVAMEYIFYVFFGLCLMSMVVGLVS